MEGPRSIFGTGGAKLGGFGGMAPSENFKFRTSKIAGFAFLSNNTKKILSNFSS